MPAQYLLEKKETCEECKGTKTVQNGLWKRFYEENPDWKNLYTGEIDQWFDTNFGLTSPPDEEDVCPECEGNGIIIKIMDLRDALKEIGFAPLQITYMTPAPQPATPPHCEWMRDQISESWVGNCGFDFNDDRPLDDLAFIFCPGCGGKILPEA